MLLAFTHLEVELKFLNEFCPDNPDNPPGPHHHFRLSNFIAATSNCNTNSSQITQDCERVFQATGKASIPPLSFQFQLNLLTLSSKIHTKKHQRQRRRRHTVDSLACLCTLYVSWLSQ
jgi:hypothetical protein